MHNLLGYLGGPVRGAVIGWYRVLRTAAQQSMEDIYMLHYVNQQGKHHQTAGHQQWQLL